MGGESLSECGSFSPPAGSGLASEMLAGWVVGWPQQGLETGHRLPKSPAPHHLGDRVIGATIDPPYLALSVRRSVLDE